MIAPLGPLPSTVLFAAGIDWLEAILPILFIGFWIVSQVFAVLRRVAGGPAKPPVVRVPDLVRDEGRVPRPPVQPEGDPRAELEKQIADFLRQVTGEAPAAAPPRAPATPPPAPKRPAPLPVPVAKRPQPGAPPSPATARRESVGERHVGTLDIQPSTVARHVQDAFEHQLGHLHSGLERPADEGAPKAAAQRVDGRQITARDLVAAARDPATIRQAILLREILERPVDHW